MERDNKGHHPGPGKRQGFPYRARKGMRSSGELRRDRSRLVKPYGKERRGHRRDPLGEEECQPCLSTIITEERETEIHGAGRERWEVGTNCIDQTTMGGKKTVL